MEKCDDKTLVLPDYRTTQLEGVNLSPAQLLMARRPRNTLLASKDLLKPFKSLSRSFILTIGKRLKNYLPLNAVTILGLFHKQDQNTEFRNSCERT